MGSRTSLSIGCGLIERRRHRMQDIAYRTTAL